MSVLAFMTDGLFARIGLSGRAAFSVLLGYGCTAAAVSSTRALENRSVQRRAVAALFFVPCSAKLPVYLTLLSSVFENTFLGAVLLYVLGTGMGLLLAAFLRREDGDFVMELTEICLPDFLSVCKKLIFRVKQFIIKVSATVLVFTVAVWFLSSFSFSGPAPAEESFLAKLCGVLRYAFYPMGIDDWRAAFAAVSGLVAKENIAGHARRALSRGARVFPSLRLCLSDFCGPHSALRFGACRPARGSWEERRPACMPPCRRCLRFSAPTSYIFCLREAGRRCFRFYAGRGSSPPFAARSENLRKRENGKKNVKEFTADKPQSLKEFTDNTYAQGSFFWEYLLRNREIRVNGKRTGENVRLLPGDRVAYYLSPAQEGKSAFAVLYEDGNLLIADKESGVNSEAVFAALNRERECFFVHRLDRNTRGLIAFAENAAAERRFRTPSGSGGWKRFTRRSVSGGSRRRGTF